MARAEELFEQLVERGLAAVDELIAAAASEELFLEFKRSADNGQGARLHQNDRNNLGRAISGFGNSEGGVVVWGVDTDRGGPGGDVAATKHPIANPARFKSLLENAVSGVTVPVHSGVRHHAINGDQPGFVVSLVPQSDRAPHQTVNASQYLMRAGSSFLPVSHTILAGMFGRRPQPNVFNYWITGYPRPIPNRRGAGLEIGLGLRNASRGIAQSAFVNLMVISSPGPASTVSFSNPDASVWFGNFAFGRQMSLIARDGVKLAPGAHIMPFSITIDLIPPFDQSLRFEGDCGCEGGVIHKIRLEQSRDVIDRAMTEFLNGVDRGSDPTELGRALRDTILPD